MNDDKLDKKAKEKKEQITEIKNEIENEQDKNVFLKNLLTDLSACLNKLEDDECNLKKVFSKVEKMKEEIDKIIEEMEEEKSVQTFIDVIDIVLRDAPNSFSEDNMRRLVDVLRQHCGDEWTADKILLAASWKWR